MQVFNACFKVIRRNLPSLLTYLFIFVFLVIMLTLFFRNPADAVFEPSAAFAGFRTTWGTRFRRTGQLARQQGRIIRFQMKKKPSRTRFSIAT
jgi:hypothetical protein